MLRFTYEKFSLKYFPLGNNDFSTFQRRCPTPLAPPRRQTPLFPASSAALPAWYLQCAPSDYKALPCRDALLRHIKLKYLGLAPFHCDPCARGFPNKRRWDQHQRECPHLSGTGETK